MVSIFLLFFDDEPSSNKSKNSPISIICIGQSFLVCQFTESHLPFKNCTALLFKRQDKSRDLDIVRVLKILSSMSREWLFPGLEVDFLFGKQKSYWKKKASMNYLELLILNSLRKHESQKKKGYWIDRRKRIEWRVEKSDQRVCIYAHFRFIAYEKGKGQKKKANKYSNGK